MIGVNNMTERYQEIEIGILDTQTGLVWEKTQNQNLMTWDEAMEYATSLGTNWRLPNIEELFSIAHHNKLNLASDLPGIIADAYWSSTTYANGTNYAWNVYFGNGGVYNNYKTNTYYVRCVSTGL
jgi:hypothetical protein